MNWTPKLLAGKPYLISVRIIRAPCLKCTSLKAKASWAACAPHPECRPLIVPMPQMRGLAKSTAALCEISRNTSVKYREVCINGPGYVAHRCFNNGRTPTKQSCSETPTVKVALWSIKVCICRTIAALLFMFGLDHHWAFSHQRIH